MKLILTVASLCALGFGARMWFSCEGCCLRSNSAPASSTITGDYIEARTASVFAGACHYNGEYVSAGREAVLAWRFDGGSQRVGARDVALAGVEIAALAVGDDNLVEANVKVRSIVYVDVSASVEQRDAALAWLRENQPDALGEIAGVETTEIQFARSGDGYALRVGQALELAGSALPDRACCSMPFNVWYAPFQALDTRVVGCSEDFAVNEKRLGARFERHGQNDAFLGRFGRGQVVEAAAL